MSDLQATRKELTIELANCERGAFPGSKESRREFAAMMALEAFDTAHPEIVEALRAA